MKKENGEGFMVNKENKNKIVKVNRTIVLKFILEPETLSIKCLCPWSNNIEGFKFEDFWDLFNLLDNHLELYATMQCVNIINYYTALKYFNIKTSIFHIPTFQTKHIRNNKLHMKNKLFKKIPCLKSYVLRTDKVSLIFWLAHPINIL